MRKYFTYINRHPKITLPYTIFVILWMIMYYPHSNSQFILLLAIIGFILSAVMDLFKLLTE